MNTTALLDWARKNLVLVLVAAFVLVLLIAWYATRQGVISAGNTKESELSASYNDGAIYLSNCVVKTKQAAGAAKANSEAFDKVIKDAVAGTGSAQHVDMNNSSSRNSLFPIWVQAYPDLKGQTALFEKAMNVIVGCQDDFRGMQSVIQDHVAAFNRWRTGTWKVRNFGGGSFPNDNLVVDIPGVKNVTGEEALKKMRQPIVDAVTSDSYQTGQQSTDDPFATPSPTP